MYDTNKPIEYFLESPQIKTWAYNGRMTRFNVMAGYKFPHKLQPNLLDLFGENLSIIPTAIEFAKRPDVALTHLHHAYYFGSLYLEYLTIKPGQSFDFCIADRQYCLEATKSTYTERLNTDIIEPLLWIAVMKDDIDMLQRCQHRFSEGFVGNSTRRIGDVYWQELILKTLGFGNENQSVEIMKNNYQDYLARASINSNHRLYLEKVRNPLTDLYIALSKESGCLVDWLKFEQLVYHALLGYNYYWKKSIKSSSQTPLGFFREGYSGIYFGLCAVLRLAYRKFGHKLSFSHAAIPEEFTYKPWADCSIENFVPLEPHPDDAPNPFDLAREMSDETGKVD